MLVMFLILVFNSSVKANQHIDKSDLDKHLNNLIKNPPFLHDLNVIEYLNSFVKTTKAYDPSAEVFAKKTHPVPLFKSFPNLEKSIPHIALGNFPTPVKHLKNLGTKIGFQNIYMKDDGPSGTLYGGNKIRKLEFFLADAVHKGVDEIICVGGAGSNCTLATAVYANSLGIKTVCMLNPQKNSTNVRKNLLITYNNGAHINHFPSKELRDVLLLGEFLKHKNETGKYPYISPLGISTPRGIAGFVNAAFELKEQIKEGLLPEPDYIYIPFGSMGSTLGLILGLKAAKLKSKVIPVRVIPYFGDEAVLKMFNAANSFLHSQDPSFPIFNVSIEDFKINHDFIGEGFGCFTKEGIEAVNLMREYENVPSEGTFTGKTLATLISDVKQQNIKPNETALFWNTYCSQDFSDSIKDIDYKNLPTFVHHYFEEDVQELDKQIKR
jgi:1-aminocyclopropane-1-carboxylate deaminase/D-cysteine desulfhydrase-like pyridoxal-dependent ACC family enzyme